MKYYEAQALLAVSAGATLHLTDAQASARDYGVTAIKGQANHFKANQPLQFKKGEVFGSTAAPGDKALELKTGAREFEARIRSDRQAAVDAKAKLLAERKKREDAVAAAFQAKRDEEARAKAAKAARQSKGLLTKAAEAVGLK